MSILNKESIDVTGDDGDVVSSQSSSTVLPSFLAPSPALSTQQALPKVSILSTTPKVNTEGIKSATRGPVSDTRVLVTHVGQAGSKYIPEEGLKDGQLDTQTGLFYQTGHPREGGAKKQSYPPSHPSHPSHPFNRFTVSASPVTAAVPNVISQSQTPHTSTILPVPVTTLTTTVLPVPVISSSVKGLPVPIAQHQTGTLLPLPVTTTTQSGTVLSAPLNTSAVTASGGSTASPSTTTHLVQTKTVVATPPAAAAASGKSTVLPSPLTGTSVASVVLRGKSPTSSSTVLPVPVSNLTKPVVLPGSHHAAAVTIPMTTTTTTTAAVASTTGTSLPLSQQHSQQLDLAASSGSSSNETSRGDLSLFHEDNSNSSTAVSDGCDNLSGSRSGSLYGDFQTSKPSVADILKEDPCPVAGVSEALKEDSAASRPGMAEVLREETAKDGTRILTVSNPASSLQEPSSSSLAQGASSSSSSTSASSQQLVSLPSQLTRSTSLSSSHSCTSPLPSIQPSPSPSLQAPATTATVQDIKVNSGGAGVSFGTQQLPSVVKPVHGASAQPAASVMPIAVSVEPSASIITFKLDELTSQRVAGEQDNEDLEFRAINVEEKQQESQAGLLNSSSNSEDFNAIDQNQASDGQLAMDPAELVRSSKRKRKHPSGRDGVEQTPGSWIRTASSLLFKIMRFKGSSRSKDEFGAAEWFNYPVDPNDAPDYYQIVQNPMDFTTMKKKLETGQYASFEEFEMDIDLIRRNCLLYNSEGTKVRSDCSEVMSYFRSELGKLQEKHSSKIFLPNTSNITPPKKPRVE